MFILQITHRYDLHTPLAVDFQSMLHNLCSHRMVWHRLGRDVLLLVVLMRIRGWPLLLALTCAAIESMAHPMVWSVYEAVVRSVPACRVTWDEIRPPIGLGVAIPLHMPKYVNLCATDHRIDIMMKIESNEMRKKQNKINWAIINFLENSFHRFSRKLVKKRHVFRTVATDLSISANDRYIFETNGKTKCGEYFFFRTEIRLPTEKGKIIAHKFQ